MSSSRNVNGNDDGDEAASSIQSDSPLDEEASLPELLSALALGARSVHALPLNDEFLFQSSFPEFSTLCQESKRELLQALSLALLEEDDVSKRDLLDPWIWERSADACDALIEKVEAYLQPQNCKPLEQWSKAARTKARGSFGQMMEGLVEMNKPQSTFNIVAQNDRSKPFVPPIAEKPWALVPLNLELVEGHGLETRYGSLQKKRTYPQDVVAPTHHVAHVYQKEIDSFSYQPWQLQPPDSQPVLTKESDALDATWVDTPKELQKLVLALQSDEVREVAIDLEAHSYRSFSGMTCLMQISFLQKNYLLDTLQLWHHMYMLGSTLANPNIVKVMHGADSDIQWLQRDFGLYVVNLFDTGRAARLLNYKSAGLAHLLLKFVGIVANKAFQLSDWRQRPLPEEMRQYAIMDTHYLLDIYKCLLVELDKHKSATIQQVLDTSRKVCLLRYDKEPFKPRGYKSLLLNSKSDLTSKQEAVLERLYDWRDETARELDESVMYVCNNQGLIRLALSCPTTVSALQSCINPMPPLVLQCAQDVLGIIKSCLAQEQEQQPLSLRRPPSSAYFKPAKTDQDEEELRRATGLSPVLGTEALYKQAGWMTPQQELLDGSTNANGAANVVNTTTTDEDEENDPTTSKPRNLLMVNSANKDYRSSSNYTTHSLEMTSKGQKNEDRTVDGLGAARAALQQDDAAPLLKEESDRARQSAARVRAEQAEKEIGSGIDLTTTTSVEAGQQRQGQASSDQDDDEEKDTDSDFEIPKSMREIYKISNRNRKKNKKSTSPQSLSSPNGNVPHVNPKKVDTLEGANEVLATAGLDGKGYFGSDSKRQRTKQDDTDDTSDGGGAGSRSSDIEFMQQIGWIKNKQEAEEMIAERGDEEGETKEDEQKDASKSFDYSSIGAIGVFHPNAPQASNPFFGGAAVAGGSLGGLAKAERKKGPGKEKGTSRNSNKQERHEKKDGRSFVYKKR